MFDSDSPDAGSIPFVNDEISPPLPFLKQSHKAGSFDSSSFNLDDSDGSCLPLQPIKKQNEGKTGTNDQEDEEEGDESAPMSYFPWPPLQQMDYDGEDTSLLTETEKQHVFKKLEQSKAQKKNTNFIKFLIKSYFKQIQEMDSETFKEMDWLNYNKNVKEQIYKNGVNNITRTAIMKLLSSGNPEFHEFEKASRHFIKKMLRTKDFLIEKIMKNSYIKSKLNKRQYLLASKVFMLRCCSKTLILRHETR